jgi:hypothetical protein
MKAFEFLTEGARIDHPEDLIFSDEGVAGAQRAIQALAGLPKQTKTLSIKWDGFPALIFGRNVDGQLILCDKYMFDKKDGSGRVTSPEAFRQYDANRGASRGDLYSKIDVLFPALNKIVPPGTKGFYWGDLLYVGKPDVQNGFYTFKPNTVTYRVRVDSPLGKRIGASVASIAVHTMFADLDAPDQPLAGIGNLPATGPVVFVSGDMPAAPTVAVDNNAVGAANAVLSKYSPAISKLTQDLTAMKAKGVISAISPFITSKISAGNFSGMLEGFYSYLATKLSGPAQAKLLGNADGYLYKEGRAGLEGMFAVWVAVYNLKLAIKQQIDAGLADADVQAFTGNKPGHEGYVFGGGQNKIKLVDRLGFTAANLAKNDA